MFNYEAIKKTATSLITNFGATATITRDIGRRFDPASGKYFTGLTTKTNLKGVRAQFTIAEKPGIAVQDGDVRLLVQSGILVPLINDNLLFNSVNYRVMNVVTESPAGTDVYYDLHLRA